MCQKKVHGIDK